MKGIEFKRFSISVDFCICFKSNGEFKYVQVVVLGGPNKADRMESQVIRDGDGKCMKISV